MLKVNAISKTFNPGTVNEKKALSALSLHLEAGDFVTVIGSNGAGKSTLLNAVAGVFYVDEGRMYWGGGISPSCQSTGEAKASAGCSRIP